jgi:glycogen(starch) synthase
MKILMLGWELPPHNSGGLGVACLQLCQALARKPIDLEFVLPYHADHGIDFMKVTAALPQNVADIIKSGIAYDSYKYIQHDGSVEWHDIYSQQHMYEHAVSQFVEGKTYDVVHAHDWLTFRAALRVKEKLGCPIILHMHSVESDRAVGGQGNPLVKEIEYTALHLADQIIVVSDLTRRTIARDYDIPLSAITVVHNSLDASTIVKNEVEATYRYLAALKSQGWKVVTNIGRLTLHKGLPNFLLAAKEVIAKVPKTMFLIVGNGEQYLELVEQAANLGIARNVIFTGFQRGQRWRDAFRIADLFVMPSVSEPFGLTPFEAIGYGAPSLITKSSGVSEVFVNCLKVDFWDTKEMANKIIGVITNSALHDELVKNANQEFDTLSWDKAATTIYDLYKHHAVRRQPVAV